MTDWHFNPSGKILFLEDVGERGYRIDRMLIHLQQANIFEDVKGIVFGDFICGKESSEEPLMTRILQRFADDLSIPVFRLPGCGHSIENLPLPFNKDLHFVVEETF